MRRRKLLSVILALSLCLTLLPGMAAAEGETAGTATEVKTSEALTTALADSAIETVRLGANIEISASLAVSRTVTLDLNGYVLEMTGDDGVIKVESGGKLTLTDSNTGKQTHYFTKNNDALWVWDDAATDSDYSVTGGVITGGTGFHDGNFTCGGGVYVDKNGTFTMNGGNIAGCTASSDQFSRGGGVYVAEKGTFAKTGAGTFTMNGGSITGCTAVGGYSYGGGVYTLGTTTLSGTAEIRDCYAKDRDADDAAFGGGVHAGAGVFNISGNVKITGCSTAVGDTTDAMYIGAKGAISGGTFDGSVQNESTISGGTFNGEVANVGSGSITAGTFNGEVTNYGTISGGTFSDDVTNKEAGSISAGTFNDGVTNEGKITGGTFNGGVTGSGSVSGATVVAKVSNEPEFLEALADENVRTIKLMNSVTVGAAEDGKGLTIDRAITLVDDSANNGCTLQLHRPLTIAKDRTLTLEGNVYLSPCDSTEVYGSLTVGAGCGAIFEAGNSSLTIHEGGTVTTVRTTDTEKASSGQLSLGEGVKLTVEGTLVNNGRLIVSDMANLKKAAAIGGDLTLDGVTIDEEYTLDMQGNLLTISGFLRFGNNTNLTVKNASKVDASGVRITGGSYYCPVIAGSNEGSITGGSFYGPVTVKSPAGSTTPADVSGGTFYDGLNGSYLIQGRKVTYMDGEDVYAIQVVNGKASAPDAPGKDGYALAGWYTEAGQKFDFEETPVTEDITLTARWSKNAPSVSYASLRFETGGGSDLPALSLPYGSTVDLTKYVPSREGFTFTGWYTDKELTKRVTSLTLTGSAAVYAGWNPFTDAGSGDWYYEDVLYVYNRGLMEGTGEHRFSPDGAVTRGQIVTILWRLTGSPVVNFAMDFSDVTEETWCAEAIRWAAAEGIAQGFDDGSFGQDRVVTREQLAAFLYREVQRQGGGFTGMWYFPLNYPDIGELGEFADEAMHWCVMTGVLQGTADGRLAPKATADRAQLSAILHRYLTVEK